MGVVEAQAMGPTVIHGRAIVGGDGSGWSQLDRQGSHWWQFGSGNCGSIGTVKTGLAGCEFVEVFLIFSGEVGDKFKNGFVGFRLHMPHIASHVEDSSQIKQNDGEVNEGRMSNGAGCHQWPQCIGPHGDIPKGIQWVCWGSTGSQCWLDWFLALHA